MSTFLELVNKTRNECGASGADLTSLGGILSKQNALFKQWVIDSWAAIQRKHRRWGFMERDFSFNTVAGQQSYAAASLAPTPLTSFREWKPETFRLYKTSIGVADEQILVPITDLQSFRDLYQFGTMSTTQQRPVAFALDTDKSILLGCTPDDIYTCRGKYQKAPQILVADTDEPDVNDYYHDLVMFRAMEKYALYNAAPEVLARAQTEGGRMMNELEAEYLPRIAMPDPLA